MNTPQTGSEMSQHETFNESTWGKPRPTDGRTHAEKVHMEHIRQQGEMFAARSEMSKDTRKRMVRLDSFIIWARQQQRRMQENPTFVPNPRVMEEEYLKRYGHD